LAAQPRDAKQLADLDIADVGIDDVKPVVMPVFDRGEARPTPSDDPLGGSVGGDREA